MRKSTYKRPQSGGPDNGFRADAGRRAWAILKAAAFTSLDEANHPALKGLSRLEREVLAKRIADSSLGLAAMSDGEGRNLQAASAFAADFLTYADRDAINAYSSGQFGLTVYPSRVEVPPANHEIVPTELDKDQ